jgi:predicted transcriptional regulator
LVYRSRPKGEKTMIDLELGVVQERFADIVWDNEPVASGELVKICEKELEWKKSTTYTVLRKLCEKGLFKNEDGIVTSLISKEEFYSAKSKQIVEDSYSGSLPAFVAAFISNKKLTAKEADEIQKMIDEFKKK